MRIVKVAGGVVLLGSLSFAMARDAEKKYQPTEVQTLKLLVAQKNAIIAQKDLQVAQQAYQRSLIELTEMGNAIKAENKWDDSVQFNPNDLTFAPAPEKKEPAKP